MKDSLDPLSPNEESFLPLSWTLLVPRLHYGARVMSVFWGVRLPLIRPPNELHALTRLGALTHVHPSAYLGALVTHIQAGAHLCPVNEFTTFATHSPLSSAHSHVHVPPSPRSFLPRHAFIKWMAARADFPLKTNDYCTPMYHPHHQSFLIRGRTKARPSALRLFFSLA